MNPKRKPKIVFRTIKSAKKRTWDMFSKYKRLKGCLETTGLKNLGICFTCGRMKHIKDLQCGHFVPGRTKAVLFDEMGTANQCYYCNMVKGGEQLLFRRKLVELHGESIVQMLENKRWKVSRHSIVELDALYYYYKQEWSKLNL